MSFGDMFVILSATSKPKEAKTDRFVMDIIYINNSGLKGVDRQNRQPTANNRRGCPNNRRGPANARGGFGGHRQRPPKSWRSTANVAKCAFWRSTATTAAVVFTQKLTTFSTADNRGGCRGHRHQPRRSRQWSAVARRPPTTARRVSADPRRLLG